MAIVDMELVRSVQMKLHFLKVTKLRVCQKLLKLTELSQDKKIVNKSNNKTTKNNNGLSKKRKKKLRAHAHTCKTNFPHETETDQDIWMSRIHTSKEHLDI